MNNNITVVFDHNGVTQEWWNKEKVIPKKRVWHTINMFLNGKILIETSEDVTRITSENFMCGNGEEKSYLIQGEVTDIFLRYPKLRKEELSDSLKTLLVHKKSNPHIRNRWDGSNYVQVCLEMDIGN